MTEIVTFRPFDACAAPADALFARERLVLLQLLPGADVQHVGGTAIPGCRTKGDLDIQVRVPRGAFEAAEAVLAAHYARNVGSDQTDTYASFKDDDRDPPLGLQLTAIDGPYDDFWRFREVLLARPDLCAAYDRLKSAWHGREMDAYRAEKSRFFESLRATPEFARLLGKRPPVAPGKALRRPAVKPS
ncbi:MAG: GrpB family protein [Myxococcales bacterium]